MRIETTEFGIDLKREGHAYLEYAVFAALRQFVSHVAMVNVCLRRSGPNSSVSCVMEAQLLPSGRAVAALRANHPYAAIDMATQELRDRIEQESTGHFATQT